MHGTPPEKVLGFHFRIYSLKQQDLPLPEGFLSPKVVSADFAPFAHPCMCSGAHLAPSRPPRATSYDAHWS